MTSTLSFFGSEWIYRHAEARLIADSRAERIAGRMMVAQRLMGDVAPARRAQFAQVLSTNSLSLRWAPATEAMPPVTAHPIRQRLGELEPRLPIDRIAITGDPSGDMVAAMPLADGSHVHFRLHSRPLRVPRIGSHVVSLLLLSGGVLLATLLLLRALASPLRDLALAADRAGHGEPVIVAEDGPEEVRRLARAVNAMQARLLARVNDRTQALAAVSHDLLTPIARLRLRAGALEADETRDAILRDLDEMQAFMTSILGYLRGAEPEAAKAIDLASIIMTIVDDAADLGADASYDGPNRLPATLPPLRVRQIVGNLVENALRHAGQARVTLARAGKDIRLIVEDDGPGIADADRKAVFEPFHRIESSRNRDSGGAGLGLAIVARALDGIGSVALENRAEGGLRVIVTLRG